MTLQASATFVSVVFDIVVFVSEIDWITVFVAVDTTEYFEIVAIDVAFVTGGPLSLVFAAEDGEVIAVVRAVFMSGPSGLYAVTEGAVGGKIACQVIDLVEVFALVIVTADAGTRDVGKIGHLVTLGTVCYVVSTCEREEEVVAPVDGPARCFDIMAVHAVGGVL